MGEQLTDWFDGSVPPARRGVYERMGDGCVVPFFSFWTGSFWALGDSTPEGAADPRFLDQPSNNQLMRWRGLASDPSAPAKREPREWIKWGHVNERGELTFVTGSRARARISLGHRERVIRVRVTEVL